MKKLFQIDEFNISFQQFKYLSEAIDQGYIIACPTNNGYSFLISSNSKENIKRLQKMFLKEKRMPVVLYRNIAELAAEVTLNQSIFKLIKKNTPSSCTFLINIAPAIAAKIVHERRTEIGIRIPDEFIVAQLLEYNTSKHIVSFGAFDSDADEFAVFADELYEQVSDIDLIVIDYDRPVIVSPSTILDCKSWPVNIIRQGEFLVV